MTDSSSKPFSLVEKGSSSSNIKTTDQVIDEIGFGTFHMQFLLICGVAISCEAMELALLVFLQGCAIAEWNLNTSEKAILASAVALGQLIGLLIFGSLSDKYGRRLLIIAGWIIIVSFGMISALSPNFWALSILRFFVGIGIASQVVMFDLAVEILPAEFRGRLLVFAEIFFVLGELIIALLAYALLDTYGWRWLVFYTAVPVFAVAIMGIWFIPESPRWLVSQNRGTEAEAVLSSICISSKRVIPAYTLKASSGSGFKEGDFSELFSKKFFTVSRKVWPIWAATTFIFYVLVIDISTYFQINSKCEFKYDFIFLINSSGLIGVAVATQLIDTIGRRISQCGLATIAGIFALILAFCHATTTESVILVMGTKAAMAGLVSVVWVAVTELYPTEIRGTAHGTANFVARFGAIFGTVYANAVLGKFFASGLAIVAACVIITYCAFYLPETKGAMLDHSYDYDPSRNDNSEEEDRLLQSNFDES
eukprot:CAMPEP_0182436382 /NCGR_PEP_ID=MMETSP1167-20130531/81240_1 /TAXON_ID=2988 /ORGANISM="Mallomonas Sp, Strain CCMP3275" /LENGTH=480 /DNA_ID=CAMNT_0024628495 /DNA_START=34 /DNA_END=1476 /DNA_ORIENTATION=-